MSLLALSDGSFLEFSHFADAFHRWSRVIENNKFENAFEIVGTYEGHDGCESAATEIDENTFVTGAKNCTLKVWNKTTCECLQTIALSDGVASLHKTRDGSTLICGFEGGSVEFRRLSDLSEVINTIQLKLGDLDENDEVRIIIYGELEDGTFILSEGSKLERWDIPNQTLLQTFTGHKGDVSSAIVLNRDIIVSASKLETMIWRVSTGEPLHKLTCYPKGRLEGIVKLTERHFATGSTDKKIRLWDEHGHNYATYPTENRVNAMTVLADGSIATLENERYGVDQVLVIRKS